jgi:acetyl-CoA carboxylase alpha subunit
MILAAIAEFDDLSPEEIRKDRREKFLSMGRAS